MITHDSTDRPLPGIERLCLCNYKSVGRCDVALRPFTALVGPNGAGKSNILDALRFTADALSSSLGFAVRERGGIDAVRRRSKGHPHNFAVRIEACLPGGRKAKYAYQVGALKGGGFAVKREQCRLVGGKTEDTGYEVREGQLLTPVEGVRSAVESDRLMLNVLSGVDQYRPLYDFLTGMGFYSLNPQYIRDLQDPDPSELLARGGQNICSVLSAIEGRPEAKARIEAFLRAVAPGVSGFEHKAVAHKQTVEFRVDVSGDDKPWRFPAANMSDGTLRALGVLVALFQGVDEPGRVPLVGIEEPEAALHPAALAALAEAMIEATRHAQVIITSHSPDLLDSPDIEQESILAVVCDHGETVVGPVDAAGRDVLRQGLYTPGELLRLRQIRPDQDLFDMKPRPLNLFAEDPRP